MSTFNNFFGNDGFKSITVDELKKISMKKK
jgi:hypothetical protein